MESRSWTFQVYSPPSPQKVSLYEGYHVDADSLGLFFRIHRNAARMQDAFNVEFNSQIEQIPQDVTCLHLCCGTWDLHFFDFSIYHCLESLAIGAGSCSKVRSFCLQEMPHLQILSIGSYSFSEAGSPINRIFSIHDCPCLEQVTIGNICFQQYSSFSVSNVPNLLMFNIGAFSFIHTSTFAMRGWLFSLLFNRSPITPLPCDSRVCFPGLL